MYLWRYARDSMRLLRCTPVNSTAMVFYRRSLPVAGGLSVLSRAVHRCCLSDRRGAMLHTQIVRRTSSNSGGDGDGDKKHARPNVFFSGRKITETLTVKNITAVAVFGSIIMAILIYIKNVKEREIESERNRSLGRASLGGSFKLVDHNGRPCSSDDLLGQWLLLYFGFTHCPDVCPDELEKMAAAVDMVGKTVKKFRVQPIFITVDPFRDDVAAVGKYVKEFHPQLLGLTGSVDQVREACRAYRVYFSEGPKDDDNDYIVDHTIIMYLVNPEGNFVDYYGQTKTAEEISNSICYNIAKYNKLVNKSFW